MQEFKSIMKDLKKLAPIHKLRTLSNPLPLQKMPHIPKNPTKK